MSLESFNVVMNSFNSTVADGDRNSLKYLINFDFLPSGYEYDLTFAFTSTVSTVIANWTESPPFSLTIIQIPEIINNVWIAGPTSSCSSTPTLGIAHLWASNTNSATINGYMFATHTDNPPIRLKNKPTTNVLSVNLFTSQGVSHPRYGIDNVNYVLILSFKQVKKNDFL
jgi:hypothetical protein